MLLFKKLKNIEEVLKTCIKPGLYQDLDNTKKKYDLDHIILAMLESVAGKITEGLTHDVINTENDCVISANEHIKLGGFLGEIAKYD